MRIVVKQSNTENLLIYSQFFWIVNRMSISMIDGYNLVLGEGKVWKVNYSWLLCLICRPVKFFVVPCWRCWTPPLYEFSISFASELAALEYVQCSILHLLFICPTPGHFLIFVSMSRLSNETTVHREVSILWSNEAKLLLE